MSPVSCSLNEYDINVIVNDDFGYHNLQRSFLEWLETTAGPIVDHNPWMNTYKGERWEFNIITTTGVTDFNLTFDDPKDAVLFKLTYGYEFEYV